MLLNGKFKWFFTIFFSILLVSCNTPSGPSHRDYLQESGTSDSVEKIQSNLTRSNAKSNLLTMKYRVEAFPLTPTYLRAKIIKQGKKEGLSPLQITQKIKVAKEINSKCTCFQVEISSKDTGEAVNLKYWGATVHQGGKHYRAEFLDTSHLGISSTTTHFSANTIGDQVSVNSYNDTTYYNGDVLCTVTKIDLLQPFELHLLPRYKENQSPLVLRWEGPK